MCPACVKSFDRLNLKDSTTDGLMRWVAKRSRSVRLAKAEDRAETWFNVAHDRMHTLAKIKGERDYWHEKCLSTEAAFEAWTETMNNEKFDARTKTLDGVIKNLCAEVESLRADLARVVGKENGNG
jgi:hypothetical protein